MGIRVFEVGFDTDFRCLFVDSSDREVIDRVGCDGLRKGQTWRPPPVYEDFLAKPHPDIWNLYEAYSFAVSPHVAALLHHQLLEVELLPFSLGSTELLLANVTEVRNYLDPDRTRWMEDAEGILFEVPEFIEHRFGGPSLFKLRADSPYMYCYESDDDPDHSFHRAVRAHGLTGLTFDEIWNTHAGGRTPASFPGSRRDPEV